jgi:hypothetical protein
MVTLWVGEPGCSWCGCVKRFAKMHESRAEMHASRAVVERAASAAQPSVGFRGVAQGPEYP